MGNLSVSVCHTNLFRTNANMKCGVSDSECVIRFAIGSTPFWAFFHRIFAPSDK